MTRRELLVLGGVAGAAALGGALVGALALQSAGGAAQLLDTTFTDLQGRPRRLADPPVKAWLINFWATWCAPCREEIPLLVAAKQQRGVQRWDIAGVAIDNVDNVRGFASNFGINYPIFVGGAELIDLMRKLGNTAGGLPYNVALDRNGAIVHRKLGALTATELRQLIDGLVQ